MMNDRGETVKIAYPGEAVHMVGFKHFPDVGNPLYVVTTPEEAKFIINKKQHRDELAKELILRSSGKGTQISDMKKAVGKLTRNEKRAIKSGDKTLLYQRLGLLEDADIQQYQSKFGIKNEQMSSENLTEALADKTLLGKKRSNFKKKREQGLKDHFVEMVRIQEEEKKIREEMTQDELDQLNAEKAQLKAMFREDADDDSYCPIIIKSNQAGSLETLLTETQKIIAGNYQMQIIETGVGPITEADIANAASTNAIIIGFDVACPGAISKRVEAAGIKVRLHKLIYKFTDDVKDLLHDCQLREAKERGETLRKEIVGEADILATFNVTSTRGKKEATVYGCRIH